MNVGKKFYFSILFLVVAIVVLFFLFSRFGWFGKKEELPVNLMLINVLSQEDFKDSHIKGVPGVLSINAPYETFDSMMKKWNKKTPIVVYCSNYFCTASGEKAKQLIEAGFENVKAYEGGIAEWYQLGYPVEGKVEKDYLRMKVKKPIKEKAGISVIKSKDLKKLIEKVTIL